MAGPPIRMKPAPPPIKPTPHVLLVDDDEDCLDAFYCVLESWGCDVTVATNAGDCLASIAESLPAAVIVDLGLPALADGIDVVREIRLMPQGDMVLIIAVTGHSADKDRQDAIAAGCDFYFVKPPDVDQVYDALMAIQVHRREVLRRRSQ